MYVETIRTGLSFLRQLIWGVTCLGLLWKWTFSHLSHWRHCQKCVLKPSEQGLFLLRWSIWGVTCLGLLWKIKVFPSIFLRNAINVCWNPQNMACFSKMTNLSGHMPRFSQKMNISPCISLRNPTHASWKPAEEGSFFWDDQFEGSHN